MEEIAVLIDKILSNIKSEGTLTSVKASIDELSSNFPLYEMPG